MRMFQGSPQAVAQITAAARVQRPQNCSHHRLVICEQQDDCRNDLEQFVQSAFAAKHGARVHSFMPTMLGMRNEAGRLCAVAGFRCAAQEPLFLERYLAQPIEHAIQAASGCCVPRSQIVEVGNLSGVSCRAAVKLVLELPRLLLSRGQQWIVFTATDSVRHLLHDYGAPLLELAPAQASRVAHLGDDWGRYYEQDPRVMAGCLPAGRSLQRRRGSARG